jgi:hypothetical protein
MVYKKGIDVELCNLKFILNEVESF